MAQDIIIRTLCDVCLADDEHRDDARPFVISNGGRLLEIDLCEIHGKPLADLIEHARPHEPKAKPDGLTCETCGKVLQTSQGMRKHMMNQHGIDPDTVIRETLFGPSESHQCDVCSRTFPKSQGLAMHRFRAHGIRSETPSAHRKRERREDEQASA